MNTAHVSVSDLLSKIAMPAPTRGSSGYPWERNGLNLMQQILNCDQLVVQPSSLNAAPQPVIQIDSKRFVYYS